MKTKLSPSMLSIDFGKVAEQLKLVEDAGTQYIHLDVMDGIFVPNISFGIPVIKSIRKHSNMVFDAHLMIVEPGIQKSRCGYYQLPCGGNEISRRGDSAD
mgnify:CR=1 FL=1